MPAKKILLVKSRDITLDDLEALEFEYEYEDKGVKVNAPVLLDHYLAYLVIQEMTIPIRERLKTILSLDIDIGFFQWILVKHAKDFRNNISAEDLNIAFHDKRTEHPYERASEVFFKVIEKARKRFGHNQSTLVKFPHIAIEHLTTGILDYYDPIKENIDGISDFLNLCNSIKYRKKKNKLYQVSAANMAQRNMLIIEKAKNDLDKLTKVLNQPFKARVSGFGEIHEISAIQESLGIINRQISFLNKQEDKANFLGVSDQQLDQLIENLEIIHRFAIHDHSFSSVFAGEEEVSFHIIDFTSYKHTGRELRKALQVEDLKNVYVFISAMSCEITWGQILGKMLHYMGVVERQIVFGGMSLNSYIPREETDIINACQSISGKNKIMENVQQLFHGFKPSMYFGFFDRDGSKPFITQLFDQNNTEPAFGFGVRAGQDGAWIDPVRQKVITDNSTYTVKAFGLPIFRGIIRALFVTGSCIHECDFCASMGSMALSNQRTAQDVFRELKWHSEKMHWLKLMAGKNIYAVLKWPVFKGIFSFFNRIIGCNYAFIDDNFRVIHPWTLEYIDTKIRESKIQFDCTTMMDVNTISSEEHRDFIHRYANSTYLGIEVICEDYIKDFKKTPAKVAIKAFENKLEGIEKKSNSGEKLIFEEKSFLRFNERLIKAGVTDRLQKGYLYQISKIIELGALPMNFAILGVNGHSDMHEVAKQRIRFTQTPLKLFNLFRKNIFDRFLLWLFGNSTAMVEQTMILSIFAGSPDYHKIYPWKDKSNKINRAVRDLIVPGGWKYDLVRMTSYLSQINFNAFRAIPEIENSDTSMERVKCNPEEVALAYYYISKSNSSRRNILKGTLGAFIATYRAKNMHPFFWRFIRAVKSSVQTSFFRFITIYTSDWLAKLAPVLRWKMYRTYTRIPVAETAVNDDLTKKLARFGMQFVQNNGASHLKLENEELTYSQGYSKKVYRANKLILKDKEPVIKDTKNIAAKYFDVVFNNIQRN